MVYIKSATASAPVNGGDADADADIDGARGLLLPEPAEKQRLEPELGANEAPRSGPRTAENRGALRGAPRIPAHSWWTRPVAGAEARKIARPQGWRCAWGARASAPQNCLYSDMRSWKRATARGLLA